MARGVEAELREAIERQERGEPMHLVDTIARLSHIAVYRNSDLEVQLADERDRSLRALHDVREQHARGDRLLARREAGAPSSWPPLDEAVASADFPFARSRVVPRLVVDVATPAGARLDISRRTKVWSDEEKLALVAHGRRLTEEALDAWPGSDRVGREPTAA